MAKSLANNALKKMTGLKSAARASQEFQRIISQETNLEDMPDQLRRQIRYVKDEELEDDPENFEIYGEAEIDALSQAMKEYGFQGVILAYPYENHFRIESGHRRRLAARKAGLTEYPVFITEAPHFSWERKLRLFSGNLHGRTNTPMILAKVAQGLYEAHKEEIAYKKENDLLKENDITALNTLVAMDLEMTDANIERYRALLKLIPDLQDMADSGVYSWSALSAASPLTEESQKILYQEILDISQKNGADSMTRAKIEILIKRLKEKEKNTGVPEVQEEKHTTDTIRKYSHKQYHKKIEKLTSFINENIEVNPKDALSIYSELNFLQKKIEEKKIELKEKFEIES